MKITAIEYIPHRMRRKVRWQTASYSADSLQLFYVKLHTDEDLTGIGAASIMPTRAAAFEPGIEALRQGTRHFVGCDPRELDRLMDALDINVPGYRHHKVAVEMALFDLKAKAENISLAQLLGGRRYDTI